MIAHHIQKEILRKLVRAETARFADLKPPGLESNIFTYHLHQLIRQKFIAKLPDGTYGLTPTGKAIGVNIDLSGGELLHEAHSILLLAVRGSDGRWLLRRRLVQPMYGRLGFLHGEPDAYYDILTSASERLLAKTGLTGNFTPRGSGYIRILSGEDIESFTHFTLLLADDVSGELLTEDSTGVNQWADSLAYDPASMIPSMEALAPLVEQDGLFFVDLTYDIAAATA